MEVAALRSQLMVLATGCRQDDRYNAFVRKYQADLMGNEKAVGDVFKRIYGKRAQQEHDRFTTDLANGESSAGMRLGTDFCERNSLLFTEVMALPGAADLPAYAAGKDLVPATVDVCPQWRRRRRASRPPRHQAPLSIQGVTVARHADRRVARDQPHGERIGAGVARGRRVVDPRVVADGVDQHLAVRGRRGKQAGVERPAVVVDRDGAPAAVIAELHRDIDRLPGGRGDRRGGADLRRTGHVGGEHAGLRADGGFSAHACSSNAVAAIASQSRPWCIAGEPPVGAP